MPDSTSQPKNTLFQIYNLNTGTLAQKKFQTILPGAQKYKKILE